MSDVQVHQLYIHGRYVEATSGKTFNSINPANGEIIATLQQASEQDIEAAVKSAQQGQKNLGSHDRYGAFTYFTPCCRYSP